VLIPLISTLNYSRIRRVVPIQKSHDVPAQFAAATDHFW